MRQRAILRPRVGNEVGDMRTDSIVTNQSSDPLLCCSTMDACSIMYIKELPTPIAIAYGASQFASIRITLLGYS